MNIIRATELLKKIYKKTKEQYCIRLNMDLSGRVVSWDDSKIIFSFFDLKDLEKQLEDIIGEPKTMQWIRVGDKQPEERKYVLLWLEQDEAWVVGYCVEEIIGMNLELKWVDLHEGDQVYPTHWCEITKP